MAVLPVPPAGLTLVWAIPPDPALWNVTVFAQALLADADALAGISNTAGLRLFLGV